MRFVAILKGTVNICPQNGQQAVKEVLSSKGARQRERGEESTCWRTVRIAQHALFGRNLLLGRAMFSSRHRMSANGSWGCPRRTLRNAGLPGAEALRLSCGRRCPSGMAGCWRGAP